MAAAAASISLNSLTLTQVESSARFDFRVQCSVLPKTVAKSPPLSRPTSKTDSVVRKEGSNRASERKYWNGFFGLPSLRDDIRLDELGAEILSIALPGALALAVDPIISLVDTANVGHIGSSELAAVGVSASIFNLVSKLFNVPLLNITMSFVAEEQALVDKDSVACPEPGFGKKLNFNKSFPSVSTSLALAAGIGISESLVLSSGSDFWMNLMGIPFDSPIRVPSEEFLLFRAFGAPAMVVALSVQVAFCGFKDKKTPLFDIGAGNLLNAILGLILIFLYGFGIGGAAISMVISEYIRYVILDSVYPTLEAEQ